MTRRTVYQLQNRTTGLTIYVAAYSLLEAFELSTWHRLDCRCIASAPSPVPGGGVSSLDSEFTSARQACDEPVEASEFGE